MQVRSSMWCWVTTAGNKHAGEGQHVVLGGDYEEGEEQHLVLGDDCEEEVCR